MYHCTARLADSLQFENTSRPSQTRWKVVLMHIAEATHPDCMRAGLLGSAGGIATNWAHLQCCAKWRPVATPSLAANRCKMKPCGGRLLLEGMSLNTGRLKHAPDWSAIC